jgi:hypothetical protein
MRLIPRLSQLFGHTTLAMLLAVAVVALPVAGVVACPVEQFDPDTDETDGDATREVELAAPSQNPTTAAPARIAVRVSPGSRPTGGLVGHVAHSDRKSPLSPFGSPLGSRLRR